MNRLRFFVLSLAVGTLFAAGVTYATVTWHGTSWITDGAVISATNIRDNFDFVHDIFAPSYAAWYSQGTGDGGAAIYNDSGTYKKLMIVGNSSAGGSREVGIWDNLTVSGNTFATGYFHNSDARLKTHIQTAPGLSLVRQLRGATFDWKDNNTPSAGVVAQEVEQVMPSAVHTDPRTGLKSVEYDQLIAPLIQAIKEQQDQIDQLRHDIDILKADR